MNMLVRILGYSRPDNREVFLFIATRAAGVDKRQYDRVPGLRTLQGVPIISSFIRIVLFYFGQSGHYHHSAVQPPSTLRLVPVVLPLRSLSRNIHAFETSSRLASFFIGIIPMTKSWNF